MVAIRNGELQCGENFLKESTRTGKVKGYSGWTFLPCKLVYDLM